MIRSPSPQTPLPGGEGLLSGPRASRLCEPCARCPCPQGLPGPETRALANWTYTLPDGGWRLGSTFFLNTIQRSRSQTETLPDRRRGFYDAGVRVRIVFRLIARGGGIALRDAGMRGSFVIRSVDGASGTVVSRISHSLPHLECKSPTWLCRNRRGFAVRRGRVRRTRSPGSSDRDGPVVSRHRKGCRKMWIPGRESPPSFGSLSTAPSWRGLSCVSASGSESDA